MTTRAKAAERVAELCGEGKTADAYKYWNDFCHESEVEQRELERLKTQPQMLMDIFLRTWAA